MSGQRETANNFRVNGADAQEDVNMGVAIVPGLDSIAELKLLTGSFDGKLGNGSGGQILMETRSGGDRLHGSAFEYLRNTALDARNYFSLQRAAFHGNQFGGTLGGPVSRVKRLHFFMDYQGTRQRQGVDTGLVAVPSTSDRAGNLSDQAAALTGTVSGEALAQRLAARLGYAVRQGEPYVTPGCGPGTCVLPGAVIPERVFSIPARRLLSFLPAPNRGEGTFSTSGYGQTLKDDKGSLRLDRTSRLGEWSVYGFVDDYALRSPYPTGQGGATVPGFAAETRGRAQLYSLRLISTRGSRTTNEARASYLRNAAAAGQPRDGLGTSLAEQGFVTGTGTEGINPLLPGTEGVANVIFNDFTIGVDVTSLFQAENIVEVGDDWSHVAGRHTVSLGADVHADEVNTHPAVYGNGSFSFTGSETGSDFADFLIGVDSSYTQGQGQNFYNRNRYVGLYGQDSWAARPGLTVNYGLRWDLLPPWREKYNQLLSLDPAEQSVVFPTAPKGILFPGDSGVPSTIAPARYNNFSPRLAVAWSPGATVIRGGFGLYYSAFEGLSAGIMSGNPPYGFTDTTAVPTLFEEPFVAAATGMGLGQRFPLQTVGFGASPGAPNRSVDWSNFEPLTGIPAFDKANRTPYAENYSLTVERALGPRTKLTASYVGTQAHRLLVIQNVNPGDPAACLALSDAAHVAADSATCGPFGESGTYTTAAGAVVNGTRTAFGPAFGSVNLQRTIGNAHSNALELSLRHESSRLFVQVGYTWSKSIDQSSSLAEAVYPETVPGGAGRSRALSAWDLTHNFVAAYRYAVPGRGRWREGWQVSGLTRVSTGFPVTLVNNNDTSLLGTQPNGINNNGVDEPAVLPGRLRLQGRPGAAPAFDTGLFGLPTLGDLGNARRRYFHGPGMDSTDLALAKTTPLRDGAALELRLEGFNVFNHGQFFGAAAVNGNVSSSNFGEIVSSAAPRLVQVAGRVSF